MENQENHLNKPRKKVTNSQKWFPIRRVGIYIGFQGFHNPMVPKDIERSCNGLDALFEWCNEPI